MAMRRQEGNSTAPHTTHELLSDIASSITHEASAGRPEYAELAALCKVVSGLTPEARHRFNEGTRSTHRTLRGTLLGLTRNPVLDRSGTRDIRTIARYCRCILDLQLRDDEQPHSPHPSASSTMHYGEIDVASLLERLTAHFSTLARERKIMVAVDVPPVLSAQADGDKLQFALLNLIFNAFKYTPPGKNITIRAHEDVRDDHLVIEVADEGPGIAPDQLDAVFERSRQMDRSVFLTLGALGFSLGTTRDLVRLHGGTVSVASAPGGGCRFQLTVPTVAPLGFDVIFHHDVDDGLATRVAETAARELRVEAELGRDTPVRHDRPLVLIVEDSRSIQRVLVDCLTPQFATACSFDGLEGFQLAKDLHPDLVVTDILMPRMDGEAMIRAIRAQPDLADTPVLVLTSASEPQRTAQIINAGANDVLRKPFVLQQVRARVASLLTQKRARDILNTAVGRKESDLVMLANRVAQQQHELQIALEEVRVAKHAAERANQIKSNFLRMMSHELKTPITAMRLHLRMVELQDNVPELVRDVMQRMSNANERLLHMIDTCIEWARVEGGRARSEVTTFDIADVSRRLSRELEPYLTRRELSLHLNSPSPHMVTADQRVVHLVLLNLLAFVVQNGERGTIELSVDGELERQRILLTDVGPPMSPEQRHEAFAPLDLTTDVRSRSGAGSGLGLYVVRDIARGIGGELDLDSVQGNRNTFAFTLPPSS